MTRRETSREIERAACDWVARVDGGDLTPDETAALEAWLAGDERRLGAYARATALFARMSFGGRDIGFMQETAEEHPAPRGIARRTALLGLSAGAIAATAAGVLLLRPTAYSTRRGEIRTISLPDGSQATLNTDTEIEVAFDAGRRFIRLTGGEALFDVAKDAARPFFVETGGLMVRVVGTTFSVRNTGASPRVIVHEGVVQVTPRSAPEAKVTMRQNQRSDLDQGQRRVAVRSITSEEEANDLAWREGKIAFNGETLAAAADEFARYSDRRIRFSDAEAANHRVIGLFLASDPGGFAKGIALTYDLQLSESPTAITLSTNRG